MTTIEMARPGAAAVAPSAGWRERVRAAPAVIWAMLERAGRRRAVPHLLALANLQAAGDPALAARLRADA